MQSRSATRLRPDPSLRSTPVAAEADRCRG
ncbi:hypothetical protein F4553_007987 [Allocatelliglobosispora scoriae]|uniref:Uncharacterized protein n=1 Tax=Allocatelliglobosispora scoriae TaxID=643052 RepID=A0A841C5Y9_9ACTN|nr:hypothetical protein [Allocatelliglobosispora scoriae]